MNFKQNNILLSKNQIKWHLQKIRESKFPKNDIFLKDISKNKNKLNKNIIFTSLFHYYFDVHKYLWMELLNQHQELFIKF